jgi:hypothetical protein
MFFAVMGIGFVVNLEVLGYPTLLAFRAIAFDYSGSYLLPVGGGEETLVGLFVGLTFPFPR